MLPKTISGMILSLAVLLSQTAWAQLPKSAVIGTNTPGTVFYALAGGLAKVASEAGPVQTTVQPYTGTSTFLPLLDNGELDFGIVNGVDMGMAFQARKGSRSAARTSFRTLPIPAWMRGAPVDHRILVEGLTFEERPRHQGKRVTGEYPAHQAVWFNMFGMMASGGSRGRT